MKLSEIQVGLKSGDRRSLAKAITLIESNLPKDRTQADELLQKIMPLTGKSIRIGISGPPGVGKSTFIESFGAIVLKAHKKIAVLAIDPTSPKTRGSILGDKTRMETLSASPHAFIRPSPSGNTSGGVHRRTREAILLCEAAGFDLIIVETVGVGQSEYAVAAMVDIFVALQMPNAGDELQGLKKGILEMADLVVVTKADKETLNAAKRTQLEHQRAFELLKTEDYTPPQVLSCSGLTGENVEKVFEVIQSLIAEAKTKNTFNKKRQIQMRDWFREEIAASLLDWFGSKESTRKQMKKYEAEVVKLKLPASAAARALLSKIISRG